MSPRHQSAPWATLVQNVVLSYVLMYVVKFGEPGETNGQHGVKIYTISSIPANSGLDAICGLALKAL